GPAGPGGRAQAGARPARPRARVDRSRTPSGARPPRDRADDRARDREDARAPAEHRLLATARRPCRARVGARAARRRRAMSDATMQALFAAAREDAPTAATRDAMWTGVASATGIAAGATAAAAVAGGAGGAAKPAVAISL